jgi:hypothetical protein
MLPEELTARNKVLQELASATPEGQKRRLAFQEAVIHTSHESFTLHTSSMAWVLRWANYIQAKASMKLMNLIHMSGLGDLQRMKYFTMSLARIQDVDCRMSG